MLTGIFERGPLLALAASILLSPAIPAVLAVTVERQMWQWSEQYAAFAFGDIALAVTVGAGAAVQPGVSAQAWVAIGRIQWCVLLAAGAFGLWQWRREVTRGVYTRSQALSPTKVWHQVLTIPLLAVWVCTALILTVYRCLDHPLATLIAVSGVVVWTLLMAYDQRHPQQGHVEFKWGEALRGRR